MIQKTSPRPARLKSNRKIRQRLRWLLRQFYGRLVREQTPAKLLQTIDSDGVGKYCGCRYCRLILSQVSNEPKLGA